jgi:FAD dependent oxidoreductase TIGR03364
MEHFDVAIVGAGIVGLSHAISAVRRGLSVLLIDRSGRAEGATVRNFGMVWPVGQPAGELHQIALRTREIWLELDREGVVDADVCGSIHVAHNPDELAVLEEFVALRSHDVVMLKPCEVLQACPLVSPNGLLGGMHSRTELRVDPRCAAHRLATWLAGHAAVSVRWNTTVVDVAGNRLRMADGSSATARTIVVCTGADVETLFPAAMKNPALRICKLQMLQVRSEPREATLPHIASGLTLRHYDSFSQCPSLARLKNRIAAETPELDHYGIHVMASALGDGRIILGDSHEYDDRITPFDSPVVEQLMIRELKKILSLSNWSVEQRWSGIYSKYTKLPVFECQPADGVHVFVGTGGAGMTMAFGLAEHAWQRWEGKS